MLSALGITLLALGILFSIAWHEIGHLVPAKRSGVKVTQYMVGFGKTIWSRRVGETEYGIKAIPLGGYIRMIGMFPPKADGSLRSTSTGMFAQLVADAREISQSEVGPEDENRVFYKQPVHRKIIIMLGGPVMNLILAVILFGVVLVGIGVQGPTLTISDLPRCVIPASEAAPDRECRPEDRAAPSAGSALAPGQRLIAFNGQELEDWTAFTDRVRASAGQQVVLTVEEADGSRKDVTLTPIATERLARDNPTRTETVGYLGIASTEAFERQPVYEVPIYVADLTKRTFFAIIGVPQRMVGVWDAAFGGGVRDRDGPVGVVGVSRLGGEVAAAPEFTTRTKISALVSILASVNLALFVFNLIPLLPLDGGHVAGAVWEGLRRQTAKLLRRPDPGPVDVARMLPVAYTVAILLIGMSALLLYADIVNPIRLRS